MASIVVRSLTCIAGSIAKNGTASNYKIVTTVAKNENAPALTHLLCPALYSPLAQKSFLPHWTDIYRPTDMIYLTYIATYA